MNLRLEEDHPSIVAVGGFDPLRFQPHWFRSQGLLGEVEAAQAQVKLVSDQVVDWSTEWFDLQVVRNKMVVTAKLGSRARSLSDLWLGVLELLDQTRIEALGLNRAMHWGVDGRDIRNRIGDALAPKALWQPYLKKRPGMISLVISDHELADDFERADGLRGRTYVTVQPSVKYPLAVYFDVNNEVRPREEPNARYLAGVIREHWQRLFDEAETMSKEILMGAAQ